MEVLMSAQDEYDEMFKDRKKLKAAFKQVTDIRKFEIELYWKRATYFWTLIAVAFAGYFAVLSSKSLDNNYFLSFVVGSIGLVFSFAWYFANRGSKYWQENWENHLDLLEDKITGPLYKTLLQRPRFNSLSEKYVTGPLSVSVSKINSWVSVFVIFIWFVLVIYALFRSICIIEIPFNIWVFLSAHLLIIISIFFCCVFMYTKGKTHKEEHNPNMIIRETKIGERL